MFWDIPVFNKRNTWMDNLHPALLEKYWMKVGGDTRLVVNGDYGVVLVKKKTGFGVLSFCVDFLTNKGEEKLYV